MIRATSKRRSKTAKPTIKPAVIDDSTWLLFSYRRFSSEGQKHGRSTDRQVEDFDEFLAAEKREHPDRNYIPHSLPMDRGMSAFYGEHRKRGHLGKFVKGIASGDIKIIPGRTILFVEEVRRFSREGGQKASESTLHTLFNAGITLRFKSGLAWSTELNAKTPGWFGMLTTLLDLAREESKQKKEWLDDVWSAKRKRARETGEIVVAASPYWLEIVGREWDGDKVIVPGECEIIPAAAKAIIKMFKLAASGLGYDLIQQQLNHDTETKGAWVPPKRSNQPDQQWRRTYIQLTLKNRAVIGEYQPHRKVGGKYGKRVPDGQPIPDFYPNVLKDHPGLFGLVQQKIASKRGISQPGPKKKYPNLVTGLAKCGYCGGAMHYGPKGRNDNHLYCYDSRGRKSPRCPMMKYEDCAAALLDQLPRLKPEQILPKKNKQQKLCEKLRQEEQQTVAQAEDIKQQIENYTAIIGRTKDSESQDNYERQIIKLRSDERGAAKHLAEVRSRLQDAERDTNSVEQWKSGLAKLKAEAEKDPEVRARLNDHISQFVERIDIFAKGYPEAVLEGNLLHYFDDVAADCEHQGRKPKKSTPRERKEWQSFKTWALGQLQTKQARFLRVYFKQQGMTEEDGKLRFYFPYIDVVPEGSIAGSTNAINTLREQFKNGKKRPRPR